jgi:hypothetical protein
MMFAMMTTPYFADLAARYSISLIEAFDHERDMAAANVADDDAFGVTCPCTHGDVCMGCDGSGFFE